MGTVYGVLTTYRIHRHLHVARIHRIACEEVREVDRGDSVHKKGGN